MSRPTVLFYCQHSLGLGHLARSFALAGALTDRFRVVLLNGGRLPRGLPAPPGVEVVSLPPLGMTVDGALVSHDRAPQHRARAAPPAPADARAARRSCGPRSCSSSCSRSGARSSPRELVPLLEAAREAPAP